MTDDMKAMMEKLDSVSNELVSLKEMVGELQVDMRKCSREVVELSEQMHNYERKLNQMEIVVVDAICPMLDFISRKQISLSGDVNQIFSKLMRNDRTYMELIDLRSDMRQVKSALGSS
ncbi:MAG: hypothetical protein Q4F28_03435 [Eubacteriales bacterium]|nr:hypothetical protein [Eubacteriales bacterium]